MLYQLINDSIMILAEINHSHGSESVWQETWELITDPAHALTEIFYSLLFDILIIPITIYVYKKLREPVLKHEIHHEIDHEHGISHNNNYKKHSQIIEENLSICDNNDEIIKKDKT